MILTSTPGALKRFRRAGWKFQQTFVTPLNDLERFVTAIFSAHGPPQNGIVTFDEVVFEPETLSALLVKHSIPTEFGRDVSLEAFGPHEVKELLSSALADWIDFAFVPTPKPYAIYADHDEYATFYTCTKGNLSKLARRLSAEGFQKVQDYERLL